MCGNTALPGLCPGKPNEFAAQTRPIAAGGTRRVPVHQIKKAPDWVPFLFGAPRGTRPAFWENAGAVATPSGPRLPPLA